MHLNGGTNPIDDKVEFALFAFGSRSTTSRARARQPPNVTMYNDSKMENNECTTPSVQVSTLDTVIQLHSNRISPQDVRCIDIVDESTNFAAAAIFFLFVLATFLAFWHSQFCTASASTVTKGNEGKLHAAHKWKYVH